MTLQAQQAIFERQNREYAAFRQRGYYIRRGYSSYFTVTLGVQAWGGFAEWMDALAFIRANVAMGAVEVVH